MHIGLLLWSILPGLLWAHWLYKRDAFQPEPLGLVLRAFIIGMLLTAPAIYFSSHIRALPSLDPAVVGTDWVWAFKTSFLVTGPLEEGLKFAAVYFFFFHHRDFDEPIDGLVYTGTVALGFASAENIVYLTHYGPEVIVLRALLSVPAHFLFAASIGYAMGLRVAPSSPEASPRRIRPPWDLAAGLLAAVLAHGAYNFALLLGSHHQEPLWGWGGALLTLGTLSFLWQYYVRELDEISPFRPD